MNGNAFLNHFLGKTLRPVKKKKKIKNHNKAYYDCKITNTAIQFNNICAAALLSFIDMYGMVIYAFQQHG